MISKEQSLMIQKRYLEGIGFDAMAEEFGLNKHTVRKHCDTLRKKGLLPKVQQKVIRSPKVTSLKDVMDVWNEKAVFCDRERANKCLFGTCPTAANKCDYCLIVNHPRGCPPEECHRYIPGGAARRSGGFIKNQVEVYIDEFLL